jgi:hypothetical protein
MLNMSPSAEFRRDRPPGDGGWGAISAMASAARRSGPLDSETEIRNHPDTFRAPMQKSALG